MSEELFKPYQYLVADRRQGPDCMLMHKDLVRMRAIDLVEDGITVLVEKLRDKKHLVPLLREQMTEIRSWGVQGLDRLVKAPRGKPFTAQSLALHWIRWRDKQERLRGAKLTIHGLRATCVCDPRLEGLPDGSIADELCMSVAMVSRYAKFADKAAVARASRDRREAKNVIKRKSKKS